VLKFLYACDTASTPPSELGEVYWPLAHEHDLRRLAQGRLAALQNLEASRLQRRDALIKHEANVLAAMRPHDEADEAKENWSKLRALLDSITKRLAGATRESRDAADEDAAEIVSECLGGLFADYRNLPVRIAALEDAALLCEPARRALEPLEGTFRRLNQLANIALAIEDPRLGVEDERIDSLRRRETRITTEQTRGQQRAEAIWEQLPEIDIKIADATENYRLERIDPVDRTILRQGIFEMLHDETVPPLVALDEALELAKTFGASESSSFVNGVLDRVLKESRA